MPAVIAAGPGLRPVQPPARIATEETIGSSQWVLELGTYLHQPDLIAALRELAAHSGGANPFFEPEFLAASVDRLGEPGKRLMILWERVGEAAFARLAFPLAEARVGFPRRPALRAWSHPFAPLSIPLVDMRDAEETCLRFAGLLGRLHLPDHLPLLFEDFPVEDPVARPFLDALRNAGIAFHAIGTGSRAGLSPRSRLPILSTAKRRHELKRQLHKLGQLGRLEFDKVTDFESIIVRFEEFLLLETRGWKGRKGTSIHVIRKTASFARQAVAALGDRGRAAIYSLRMDGRAIAALIMLHSGGRYYPWKIAFDEHYRAYSPGIQLMVRATDDIRAAGDFVYADSLAREESWMDRVWPDRVRLDTLIIALPGDAGAQAAARMARAVERHASLRHLAQHLFRRAPHHLRPAPPPGAPSRGISAG